MNLQPTPTPTSTPTSSPRPTIEEWFQNNPGWHTVETVTKATGYAYSTVQNICYELAMNHKVIRDGAERKRYPKYAAIVDWFGGYRLRS
jgi:hypothetical protein